VPQVPGMTIFPVIVDRLYSIGSQPIHYPVSRRMAPGLPPVPGPAGRPNLVTGVNKLPQKHIYPKRVALHQATPMAYATQVTLNHSSPPKTRVEPFGE
jgi:hypothetical protein